MTPIDIFENALHAVGKNVKRRGDVITAQCPAHEDRNASLSVGIGLARDLVICCHAKCNNDDIMAAVGLQWSDLGTTAVTPDATYDYTDANGRTAYQVVRKPGKKFQQRRPDGAGGWIYDLKGVTRTIYRLPDVIKTAAAGGVIYVCEGEKDVDRMGAEGATATCNSGGAGDFKDHYAEHFRGASLVVIIADRDEPGVKHANDVATACQAVNVPCRIVQAAKGKDAADHFTFGGTLDTFVALDDIDNEPTVEQWPEPIPITEAARPAFPLHIFPEWVAAQVRQASEEMQLPPDLAAQLAITALSIVTAGRVEVRINGRWKEWTNTYTVTALPPSAGKSPTVGMMTGALDKWEEELAEDAERRIDDRNIERKHLEKLRDDAQKREEITTAKGYADQLRDIPPIVAPRLMADDATPEKLVDMLHDQGGRMALVSTEGGMFGMMTGRYSDKANLDVYLGGWSGDTIRVDRVERGSKVVRRPRLTVGITVQPNVLVEVGRNRELVGRGLTARLMYSMPFDTVGTRDKLRESTYCDHIEERYSAGIIGIARLLNSQPDDEPRRIELSPEARRMFLSWTAGREELLKPFGPLRHMAEWIAKCDSTTARLAGLLHTSDGNEANTIDVDVVKRAIEAGDYWTEHARSTFDMMGASDDLGHARFVYEWLHSRRDTPASISFRDIQQQAKKRITVAADLIPAVEMLVEHGWLRPQFDDALGNHLGKGKPSPIFDVHPALRVVGNVDVGDVGLVGDSQPESGDRSPTVPHIPHIGLNSENDPPETGNVGDVGDVGHRRPLEINSSHSESTGGDATNPGPTSPTSTVPPDWPSDIPMTPERAARTPADPNDF